MFLAINIIFSLVCAQFVWYVAWYVYCMYMVCAWYVHGMYMVCAWYVHDMCLACGWYIHGMRMVCMACTRKNLLGQLWNVLESSRLVP